MTIDPIAELKSQLETVTQTELAKKMKISKSYLSELLSGNRGVGEKVLKYLKLKVVYERR